MLIVKLEVQAAAHVGGLNKATAFRGRLKAFSVMVPVVPTNAVNGTDNVGEVVLVWNADTGLIKVVVVGFTAML